MPLTKHLCYSELLKLSYSVQTESLSLLFHKKGEKFCFKSFSSRIENFSGLVDNWDLTKTGTTWFQKEAFVAEPKFVLV